jgi:CHAT domain
MFVHMEMPKMAGQPLIYRDFNIEMAGLKDDGRFRKRGQLVLETADNAADFYPSDQLAGVLGNAGVRLVVLGACNSAARDEGGAWTGVAPALVREKVPAVVAMQYPLADKAAARFLPNLYTRVLAGYSLDEAVFEGRQAIFSQARDWAKDYYWGVPVIYLHAKDGFLFPTPTDETDVAGDNVQSPTVRVQQDIKIVEGQVIGAVIEKFLRNNVGIFQNIDAVKPGATVIGATYKG